MSKNARKYDKEFKISSVKLFLDQGKPIEEAAKNLGVPKSTLYTWVQEYKANKEEGFRGSGTVKACNKEAEKLKKQLADVIKQHLFCKI